MIRTAVQAVISAASRTSSLGTGGGIPAWVTDGAAWEIDGVNNRAWIGSSYSTLAAMIAAGAATFSRASSGLYTSSAGVLSSFASGALRYGDQGLLIEPARTNKNTNYNANPTDLTNVTKGGDAAAILTVVDDAAALASAGLSGICTSGDVYKLDNSAGTGTAWADVGGDVGNTNVHVWSADMRGTGTATLRQRGSGAVVVSTTLTSSYVRIVGSATPSATSRGLQVNAAAGAVVYFALNQLEEGSAITSPIITTGSAATRAADALTLLPAAGTYDLTYTFDDDSTQAANGTVITGSGYAVPTNLTRRYIKKITAVAA